MANKLKNINLTSVDLVRRGANQEADICLFKGLAPHNSPETPTEHEKNIFKRFINWLRENPTEAKNKADTTIEKEFQSFEDVTDYRDKQEKIWKYTSALSESIKSIVDDRELNKSQKLEYMNKSLTQFDAAMVELFKTLCADEPEEHSTKGTVQKEDPNRYDCLVEVEKWNPYHDARGRFASASGGAAGGVSSRTISGGGISVHVKSGKEPKTGYMCATYAERAEWIKGDDVKDPEKRTAAIKSFMEKNKDVLSDPDNYLGTWYDTESGNISLDISRNFKNKDAAIKYASEHNEKAIWDVANMSEIPTGGTGNNL